MGTPAAGAASDTAHHLLTAAAGDERWRVRELAATGMQRVLRTDWASGLAAVRAWLRSDDPLECVGR